jgi:Ribbon-helix-helix protein, copG family
MERNGILQVMVTSIHIPKPLLEAVDRKARALKVSRDRLIVQALEKELAPGAGWSPGFFDQLRQVDADTAAAVDDLLASVRQARTTKPPRAL